MADGEGQCWDVGGLYIADASTHPTATGSYLAGLDATSWAAHFNEILGVHSYAGVNPMITANAIAYMVAQGVADRFERESSTAISYED